MKIFLGNPPWKKSGRLGVRAGSRWPFTVKEPSGTVVPHYTPFPFFLAYATAVLERAGKEVLLVDAIAEGISEKAFLNRAEEFDPDLIVLETSTPSFSTDLRIAREMKRESNKKRLVALCGPHVSIFGSEILHNNKELDFLLIGEYEYTLAELVNVLESKGALSSVLGIVFFDEDGAIITNKHRTAIQNLNELPWPAYSHLPMYNYNDDFRTLQFPNVQMWASRGCPYRCIFCMWPQAMYGNHNYRARDPVLVVDEMEWLLERYGFRSFYFDDDTFNLGKKRIIAFSQELIRRGITVPWACMARADTADEEMLEVMARAGLAGIKYGIESAAQEVIDSSGKKLDLMKARRTIADTKKLGVKVHLTFTFGLPGETAETIDKTIAFALEQQTHSVQFSITTPFPGTQYYIDLKEKGLLQSERWEDYDGNLCAVMRTEHLSARQLHKALRRANKAYWRARPGWAE